MKWISNLFGSLRALAGSFGLIYLLMAVAVLGGIGGTFYTIEGYFSDTWLYMDMLTLLQQDARTHLGEMDLAENRYILSYVNGETNPADLQAAQEHRDAFVQSLDEVTFVLDEYPEVFSEDIGLWLEDLSALLDDHQDTMLDLESDIQAYVEPDWDLYYQVMDENIALQEEFKALLNEVNQERTLLGLEVAYDIGFSVMLISAALVLLLVLALGGYRTIASMLQPLLVLTNAVMAIGGQQYEEEMLADLSKRRTLSGKLAKSLDQLARFMEQRDADLQGEVQNAQQELYESRRRRLKISRPVSDESASQGGAQ